MLVSTFASAKSDSLELEGYIVDYSYDEAKADERFRLTEKSFSSTSAKP